MSIEMLKVEKNEKLSSTFVENYTWLWLYIGKVQNLSPENVEKLK
jgi:hypothetical protein